MLQHCSQFLFYLSHTTEIKSLFSYWTINKNNLQFIHVQDISSTATVNRMKEKLFNNTSEMYSAGWLIGFILYHVVLHSLLLTKYSVFSLSSTDIWIPIHFVFPPWGQLNSPLFVPQMDWILEYSKRVPSKT